MNMLHSKRFGDSYQALIAPSPRQTRSIMILFLVLQFLSDAELGNEELILREWLDVCVTDSGLIVARQKVDKPPLLVAQMTEEWLNHYRKLA